MAHTSAQSAPVERMSFADLPDFESQISFRNHDASSGLQVVGNALAVVRLLGLPNDKIARINRVPTPQDIRDNVWGETLVDSHGGDGTTQLVIEAMIGHVRDDPEATANNEAMHSDLLREMLLLACADGNANNFALSALEKYATNPALLAKAKDLGIGHHQPMMWEISDDIGNVVQTGISTSSFGLGNAAIIAAALHERKPELASLGNEKLLGQQRRLMRETGIMANTFLGAEPFSADYKFTVGRREGRGDLPDVTGYELIRGSTYAKLGSTNTDIHGSRYQVVMTEHYDTKFPRHLELAETSTRLLTGRHDLDPVDFGRGGELSIRITSDNPVPFHADGEIDRAGNRLMLQPGYTVRLRLANLAVPTLIKV